MSSLSASPGVASCWITGVSVTLTLTLFFLVSCDAVMGLVITVTNTGRSLPE